MREVSALQSQAEEVGRSENRKRKTEGNPKSESRGPNMKLRRMVQVLHKMDDPKDGGGLAVGKSFQFQSGDCYTV